MSFTKQSELAHEAAELIQRCPDTVCNLKLILSGLIKAVDSAGWGDLSLVSQHLGDAMDALDEVRAHSDEEIADWTREHMQDARRAA